MSSKSPETKRRHHFPRISSITGRLAFLYIISAVVTLAIGAVYVNWSLRSAIFKAQNDFIDDRLHVYRSLLRFHPQNLDVVKKDIEWEGSYATFPEYFIRIVDKDGHTIVETPGMQKVLPPDTFLCPPGVRVDRPNEFLRVYNGRCFLLRCDIASDSHEPTGGWAIQIGHDITAEEKIIDERRKQMIALIILGIIGATGVGVVVAREALSPLQEITGVAEQITVERISERIDPTRWPTEMRSFAIAFNGMLSRLEDSFIRLSQCASNLAHELRTPINNLLVEADVALSRARSPEEYQRIIESSVEEFQRLSRLIDNLLFLARAENPSIPIEHSFFDPLEEIRKVCSFYEAVAEEHGASISIRGEGRLYGDQIMFGRVISNLVANALYYSPPGVKIDIFVREASDRYLEVFVTDTGYGIEPRELSRIFDRFYRVESLRVRHPEGSGLGLSIVKSIMDLHGGSVSIESTPGKGTSILLRFPLPQEA
jgi:two-component system heavy metal sensor histidine kinase CusS